MNTTEKHPIRVVSRRTGLSPHVIRVWERRYEAVTPMRSSTNRRMYSSEDIERLLLLRLATESGYSIGEIAGLPDERLAAMISTDIRRASPKRIAVRRNDDGTEKPSNGSADSSAAELFLDESLAAIKRLDAGALEEILSRAAMSLSRPDLMGRLLEPLMNRIGDMWQDGTLRIAHEHLASAVVRSFLGNIVTNQDPPPSAPVMVITTPAGQNHEMGALIAASAALTEGWNVTYLGPNLPAEEIAAVAEQNGARAVALSIVYPPDDPRLGGELEKLRRLLPQDVIILAGGRAAEAYTAALDGIDAVRIANIPDFRKQLIALRTLRSL